MKSVMLVDDSTELRAELGKIFAAAGWEVFGAGSLYEYELLSEVVPFDVVLADRRLPDGDGASLVALSRSPVIIFSGDTRSVPGAFAMALKPFSLSQLVRLAESALRR